MCFKEKLDKIIDSYNEKVKYKEKISKLEKDIIILKEKIKYFEDMKKIEREKIIKDLRDIKAIY